MRQRRYVRIREIPTDVYLFRRAQNGDTSHTLVAECTSEKDAKKIVRALNALDRSHPR